MAAPGTYSWSYWFVMECPGLPDAAFVFPLAGPPRGAFSENGLGQKMPVLFCSKGGQVVLTTQFPYPSGYFDGSAETATTGFFKGRGMFNPVMCFF